MTREPYPLAWPDSWKRTSPSKRLHSRFKANSFVKTRDTLFNGLRLMNAAHVVITSDLPVKSNGMPYATGRADDPGIAVWFVRKGNEQVIACDCYLTIHENLRSIQLTIDAIRGIERWGASDLVDRAFAGFAALPSGAPTKREWWEVLELAPNHVSELPPDDLLVIAKQRYRKLALTAHPDRGGSNDRMTELTAAMETAEKILTERMA